MNCELNEQRLQTLFSYSASFVNKTTSSFHFIYERTRLANPVQMMVIFLGDFYLFSFFFLFFHFSSFPNSNSPRFFLLFMIIQMQFRIQQIFSFGEVPQLASLEDESGNLCIRSPLFSLAGIMLCVLCVPSNQIKHFSHLFIS